MVLQQLATIWGSLGARRRVLVIAATLATIAAVLALGRMASQPSMALLYAGLEQGAAGEVVAALEARGIPYEVRGGAILVVRRAKGSSAFWELRSGKG